MTDHGRLQELQLHTGTDSQAVLAGLMRSVKFDNPSWLALSPRHLRADRVPCCGTHSVGDAT